MMSTLSYNDGVLLFSLLYSCVDLQVEWDMFSTCHRPIHQWLLVSYACVVGFRVMHVLGMQTLAGPGSRVGDVPGDFLTDLRHKNAMTQFIAFFTWLVALPFFIVWTLLGTSWLLDVRRETPMCVPTATHMWFSGFWLALCYVWIVVHVALGTMAVVREMRIRRAETDLREIADADVISRWGQVNELSGDRPFPGPANSGLTPKEIRALPCEKIMDDRIGVEESLECSICLNAIEPGDSVRHLPSCKHTFHKSCIDLWLLRRADCPLCKRCVREDDSASV